MDGSQSPPGTKDFNPMTLEDAYKQIGVTDYKISDGDVVVAFYNERRCIQFASDKGRWTIKAL